MLYRVCRLISVGISRALFPGRVIGRENLPGDSPFILAPVHRSYLDWLIVARVTSRRMRYIAKAELWKSKTIGQLLEALGAFPVNRSGADREALERCRAVLAGGEPLVMFPEGTRRSGTEVKDLREGVAYLAMRAGVPVVPVGIGGSERAMPRGSVLPRPHRVIVVVGPPVFPPVAGGDPAGQSAGSAGRGGGDPAGQSWGSAGQEGPAIAHAHPGRAYAAAGMNSAPGSAEAQPRQDAAGRPARVSRRALHDFSEEVKASIQRAFDQAEADLRG
jgi:1-acyl-sn-glycerol-3-phosphate acyltransferase